MIYLISILVVFTSIYFCSIAWVTFGFILTKQNNKQQLGNNKESNISVIIPVRNEENNITQCLNSLQNQNYNRGHFEIIIINDHSTDHTAQLVNNFIDESILDISIVSLSDKTSKKEALKYGIAKSKYNIIATSDGDCILPQNWLKNISLNINENTEMLLGPIVFKKSSGFLHYFQMLDMFALQGVEFGTLYYQQPILNNAANLSYSKNAYHTVGGFDTFDTPSGDDVFLLEKFTSKNKNIKGLLRKDFIVKTASESTLIGFLNQRLRWSSKSKYYKGKLLLFFSLIVLIQNISLLFIYFGIAFVVKYRISFIILLFSKWLIDFILLFLVASFYHRKKVLLYFIPIQIVYPFYIFLVWIASITMKFEWKGRKFNG